MLADDELARIVAEMRAIGCDLQRVEVKEAVGKLPKSVGESISAFANGSGGVVILGLSERDGFKPVKNFQAHSAFDALAGLCADRAMPPVRPDMRIASFEGAPIVVAEIPETPPVDKPCYLTERGMYRGSFVRTGDGDRLLSSYEIDRLVEERTQPHYDLDIVEGAQMSDLDPDLVAAVLRRQRGLHPRVFGQLSDADALAALNVSTKAPDGTVVPTLAGLLALGVYPQRFFPRLTVTFASFLGVDKAAANGVKYTDSQSMAGPIPAVLMDTVAAVRRNMRVGGVLVDGLRRDVPDYPLDAVREAVCNALMHRDYSPMGRGAQVQVNMYADRLEVLSPGGLYGAVTVDTIGEVGASSTRNQHLSLLLETTPYEEGGFVAENRGTGFSLIESELRAFGMEPPEVVDRPSLFSLTIKRRNVDRLQRIASSEAKSKGPKPAGGVARAPRSQKSEAAVLSCIREMSEARASDVVKATGLSRSTVANALKKLLGEGKIEAVFADGVAKTNPKRAYRAV